MVLRSRGRSLDAALESTRLDPDVALRQRRENELEHGRSGAADRDTEREIGAAVHGRQDMRRQHAEPG